MTRPKGDLTGRVEDALDSVRESLAMHGGGIELLAVDEETGTVTVRLQGACAGCPMADMTIATLVEETLRSAVPGVQKVVNSPA